MAPSEMGSKYAELYSRLVDSAHAALNAAADVRPSPPPEPEPLTAKGRSGLTNSPACPCSVHPL
jgi:hypothetical protein